MMHSMKRRGPDDEGIYINKNVGLGFVRLSVLDLSIAGHQPMVSKDQRYVIEFNGEIFNYIELREELVALGCEFSTHTDTEVLLYSYIYFGKDCLDKLNGMFAFVIYDKLTNSVFGARDRFGIKPLYYYKSSSEFIFASTIESILKIYNKKNVPNNDAIFDYLVFNRTDQTECTFFKNIYKLQHGMCFDIKNNEFKKYKWYDLAERVRDVSIPYDSDKYRKLLINSIKLRLRSDVPVGVCLSGGLDSSAITSLLLHEFDKKDLHTFSDVYDKDSNADESYFIDLYKEQIKTMYKTFPTQESLFSDLNDFVRLQTEPMPSTGPYAQYRVMKLAHEYVTVTLDGQGADEELGGYHYFYGMLYKSLLKRGKILSLLKEIFIYLKRFRSLYAIKTFVYFLLPAKARLFSRVKKNNYLFPKFVSKHSNSVISDNLYGSKSMKEALINHFEFKLEHLLKWDDINSMAFSVESRTPFLDYELVEYTLSTVEKAKIHNGWTKFILRDSMRDILPEKIRLRKDKKGFSTPQDEWFRSDLFVHFIHDLLDSKSFSERGIINVLSAKKLYQKHLDRQINISKDIWKWINLELWFRMYID